MISILEKITPIIMIMNFHENPQTSVTSWYSPTNVSDEQETERFYKYITSLTRQMLNHNVLINGGDFMHYSVKIIDYNINCIN